MKSGSWASYQAALPVEARAGGEPDDDEPRGPTGPPDYLVVRWHHDEECRDFDTGEVEVHRVQSMRTYLPEAHGGYRNAARAAERFARLMASRHRVVFLGEGWDDGESFDRRMMADGEAGDERRA